MPVEFYYKKSLGQCFLKDKNILRKINYILNKSLPRSATIVEIGPGFGALTTLLLRLPFDKLILIEKDRSCVERLNELVNNYYPLAIKKNSVIIVNKDVRNVELDDLTGCSYYLVGNIPYYITGYILADLLMRTERVKGAFFMLQKEVFEKINAKVGSRKYSYLSVLMQAFFDMELFMVVSPTCFYPPPKVYSVYAGFYPNDLRKNWSVDKRVAFQLFLKKAFLNRRKLLKNNIELDLVVKNDPNLSELGQRRPQELSVLDWIRLFECFMRCKE